MKQAKFNEIPLPSKGSGLSEVEYAIVIAQILMLKAYHFNEPQKLQLTCGDESFDITFTKENVEHLIPLRFRH